MNLVVYKHENSSDLSSGASGRAAPRPNPMSFSFVDNPFTRYGHLNFFTFLTKVPTFSEFYPLASSSRPSVDPQPTVPLFKLYCVQNTCSGTL